MAHALPTSAKRRCDFLQAFSSNSVAACQENDLIAIEFRKLDTDAAAISSEFLSTIEIPRCRLCVVLPDGHVSPLCQHEDDVPTDLYLDPRFEDDTVWQSAISTEQCLIVQQCYGEGWYGQRPIPSLGGGPGYGVQVDEVWSVSEEVLEQIQRDGLPVLDVGMAHGEKARSGRGTFSGN